LCRFCKPGVYVFVVVRATLCPVETTGLGYMSRHLDR
jgi:hypothetical protein